MKLILPDGKEVELVRQSIEDDIWLGREEGTEYFLQAYPVNFTLSSMASAITISEPILPPQNAPDQADQSRPDTRIYPPGHHPVE